MKSLFSFLALLALAFTASVFAFTPAEEQKLEQITQVFQKLPPTQQSRLFDQLQPLQGRHPLIAELYNRLKLAVDLQEKAPALKICTREYAPVCGVDGKTYGNKCTAGEVEIAYQGECGNEFIPTPRPIEPPKVPPTYSERMCAQYYDPVCGVDGNTYSNACMSGVEVAYKGECGKPGENFRPIIQLPKRDRVCPMIYAPVCGVDGKTYGSDCEAGDVEIAYQGECGKPGKPERPIVPFPDDRRACPMNYDPVCGVDGKTYGNACTAGNVPIAYRGECQLDGIPRLITPPPSLRDDPIRRYPTPIEETDPSDRIPTPREPRRLLPNQETSQTSSPNGELVSYTLVRVVDGDTIVVKKDGVQSSVRLIGIDAPENSKTRYGYTEPYGDESKKELERLIAGQEIFLEFDETQGEKDKYNRLLAYVFVGEMNINQEMLHRGMAKEYTYNAPYKYAQEFFYAERTAQEAKRGIWSEEKTDVKTTSTSQKSPRTYHDGPNGGCYYFAGTKKKYVAHSYCGR